MTGFRVAPGGAQQLYNIKPDLTTLGKVIGGGLPIAAYGGRSDIMTLHRAQRTHLSGGHAYPVIRWPCAAGLAMLRHIQAHPEIYDQLDASTGTLAACAPESVTVNRVGSMMTWFFTRSRRSPITTRQSSATPAISRGFFTPCSNAESICRLRSSKRCSSRQPTRKPISNERAKLLLRALKSQGNVLYPQFLNLRAPSVTLG